MITKELSAHIEAYERRFPGLWQALENHRQAAPQKPTWDKAQCFMPIGYTMNVLISRYRLTDYEVSMNAAAITAMFTWRYTGKHVAQFDPTLLQEVIEGEITGDIPCDILLKMPFSCIYVPLQERDSVGILVHIEQDHRTGKHELCFVQIHDDPKRNINCFLLELKQGTLDTLFEQTYISNETPLHSLASYFMQAHSAQIKQILMRYTNITLYLCAQNAEIVPKTAKPAALKPNPKHKLYNTPTPTVWGVGERIGAILRASSSAAQTKSQGGNGAAKRPHVRRAHSHAYRVGPGRVNTILKWMHPMLINIEDPTDLPTTIRPVK